jgi:hypothetical protein
VGTAAQESNTSKGTDAVRKLMEKEGINDPGELKRAEEIYNAVRDFLENTDFNPNLLPPHKY